MKHDNRLFEESSRPAAPVTCLGQTFENDNARRDHFLKLLAEKLKDPVFRKQEGFPKGTDEAIMAMSDPPYYTACPNPWLADFVLHYGKPYDPQEPYSREPLAIDVSEGKTDPLYKAHSYHTKVPHLAIVPSILHYTKPGDIVLDGFAGSGMTGVAAQWCGTAPATYRHELETAWKKADRPAPQWGVRRVVLNDLSPAATFIAANYNLPFDIEVFAKAGKQLLQEIEQDIGWMYETLHIDGVSKGRIEYTVWSQVYACPDCTHELIFTDVALDEESKRVKDTFSCPYCGVELTKLRLEKLVETHYDSALKKQVQHAKRVPTLISYKINGNRYEKRPDKHDIEVIQKIINLSSPVPFPVDRMMHASLEKEKWGDKWRAGTAAFSHVHHIFLPRSAHALSRLWEKSKALQDPRIRLFLLFMVEQGIKGISLLNRYKPIQFGKVGGSQVGLDMPGVYYISSLTTEVSPWYQFDGKLDRLIGAFNNFRTRLGDAVITTGSAANCKLQSNSVDYIFTDPPFGENLAYSELNFIVEAFHAVYTNQRPEAVVSNVQAKKLLEYHQLMKNCFQEYFRVLKPGRWITIVFSNTSASVWNGIQVALQEAGLVIANISALSKVQGSFNAVVTTTSVKQDLVISAYKPSNSLEMRFLDHGATVDSAWDFVQNHLQQLPSVKIKTGVLEFITERDPRILFDRMVAWFIRHGAAVPMSTQEFQEGIRIRFLERDGMVFLSNQVIVYDQKRAQMSQAPQMEMFVCDERSAIDWLTDFLRKRPSTYQEIHPEFITQLGAGWKKHEARPELSALLDVSFLRYDGTGDVPSQIHSYLSTNHKDFRGLEKSDPRLMAKSKDRWYVPDPGKAQDLEKKQEKALLKEFEEYRQAKKKLKVLRIEAVRAGFKRAWQDRDYTTIIAVANLIPSDVLEEDPKLLMWYDQAVTRIGGVKENRG